MSYFIFSKIHPIGNRQSDATHIYLVMLQMNYVITNFVKTVWSGWIKAGGWRSWYGYKTDRQEKNWDPDLSHENVRLRNPDSTPTYKIMKQNLRTRNSVPLNITSAKRPSFLPPCPFRFPSANHLVPFYCPRSLTILYKMGHYFLDTQYYSWVLKLVFKMSW